MEDVPIRIIQISDIHVFANREAALLGVKTQESFDAVAALLQREKMDLIILSGDLSQDGSEDSYTYVANKLKEFNVPIYCVPGNHDDAKIMAHVYPRETISNHKHIVLKNWHIILLNSQVPGAVHGYLDAAELKYLQHCLQTYPEHHAIVLFHHQPVLIHCKWLDNIGLKNAEELWQLLASYPKVNSVIYGHIHQVNEQTVNGIKCYSAPATCFQFMRNQDEFGLENLPPGYRWYDLHADGHLETGVVRTATYIGEFEANSKGYK